MQNISYAGCIGLTPAISSQCTLKMCAAAKKERKITKKPILEGSKSFKVIHVNKSKKLVASACRQQRVCTYLQSFSRYMSQYQ